MQLLDASTKANDDDPRRIPYPFSCKRLATELGRTPHHFGYTFVDRLPDRRWDNSRHRTQLPFVNRVECPRLNNGVSSETCDTGGDEDSTW